MAYMSQEKKSKIAPVVKQVLAKYGVKGSLAVSNHMTLVLNIKSGPIDFIQNYNDTVGNQPGGFRLGSPAKDCMQINPYHYENHFSGKAKNFLKEILTAMNDGNYDNSDVQSDYFSVGWYVEVNIGNWNKPYILAK